MLLIHRWRTFCFWLACAVLGTTHAIAQDHIVERAWIEDATGQLQLHDIQQLPARTFEGVLSQGFGEGAVWVRLRIDPSISHAHTRNPDQLVLRIRPVYLDDIQVFDPLAPGGQAGATGDRVHLYTAAQLRQFLWCWFQRPELRSPDRAARQFW